MEDLNKISLANLRKIGRELNLSNPTGITKRELINQITATLGGDGRYLKKNRRGRPYMVGYSENILSDKAGLIVKEQTEVCGEFGKDGELAMSPKELMDIIKKRLYEHAEENKRREIKLIDDIFDELNNFFEKRK